MFRLILLLLGFYSFSHWFDGSSLSNQRNCQ